MGRQGGKPLDTQVTVRVPTDLHTRLQEIATADQRTLADVIRRALERGAQSLEGDVERRADSNV